MAKTAGRLTFKISHRMFAFFQAATIGTIILFVILIYVTDKLHNTAQKILMENVSSIQAAYNVETSLLALKGLKANYIIDGNNKWLNEFDAMVLEFNKAYNTAFESAKTDGEKNILSIMAIDFNEYILEHRKIISALVRDRKSEAVEILLGRSHEIYSKIYAGCEDLIEKNQAMIQASEDEAAGYLRNARITGYGVVIFFVLAGIMLALSLSKSIFDPIKEMQLESDSVMGGSNEGRDEIAGLKIRFEKMVKNIKDSQQKLVHAEKRAAIGQLAAGISHELNNPIGVICGFSERLIEKGRLKGKDLEIMEEIYSSAKRCRMLLGDILEFAREPKLRMRDCELKSLAASTVGVFRNQEKYSGIAFKLSAAGKKYAANADEDAIKQVLVNLIMNSGEAMNYKGKIVIELAEDKNFIEVSVKDTGPGIKPGGEENVFSPFFTTKSKGIGLGLSICRNIAEKHGGSLSVEKSAAGAHFKMKLPKVKT